DAVQSAHVEDHVDVPGGAPMYLRPRAANLNRTPRVAGLSQGGRDLLRRRRSFPHGVGNRFSRRAGVGNRFHDAYRADTGPFSRHRLFKTVCSWVRARSPEKDIMSEFAIRLRESSKTLGNPPYDARKTTPDPPFTVARPGR